MPEHVLITDPDIHEPKGASTAVNGTVYVADGVGSGAWESPLPSQSTHSGKVLTTNGTSPSWLSLPSLGVLARGSVSNGTAATNTVTNSSNITSCTMSGSVYTITFSTPLASTDYQIMLCQLAQGATTDTGINYVTVKSTTTVSFGFKRATGASVSISAFDILIIG